MERTKTPSNTKRTLKRESGSARKCSKDVIAKVTGLCKLGLTDWQLAEYFEVHIDTLAYWKRTNRAFRVAVERGRTEADVRVAEALYNNAVGHYKPAVKFFKNRVTVKEFDGEGNVTKEKSWDEIIEHPYQHYYPPETHAAKVILATRHRDKWQERLQVDHLHAHLHTGSQMDLNDFLEQLQDREELSDEELKIIANWGQQLPTTFDPSKQVQEAPTES